LAAIDSQFPAGNIGGATFFASGSFDDFVVTSLSGGVTPAAPTSLAATPGNGQVSLSWNASSGATSYNIKRATVSGGPYTTVGTATSTSFTNTGLTNGTTFFYVVTAVNSAGESPNSNQATATPTGGVIIPTAPTGLTATAGNGQVSLAWSASAGATSYNIKRATVSGGPYANVGTATSTSFTNTGLTNGTTFFFVVSAVNSAGESANSNQATATPTAGVPAAPTGLTATAGNGQVSLSWNATTGATSYNIKRSTVSGGPFNSVVASVSGTSFTNTGLANGTTFFFVVSAQNSAGQGPNSAQVSATPNASVDPGDLFVAPNGTDSNPGTIDQPTTLASAVTRIAAGKTIFMRGGTYNYSTTVTVVRGNNGTSSQPKNIFAFANESPVVNFSTGIRRPIAAFSSTVISASADWKSSMRATTACSSAATTTPSSSV
jgi:cellulose 1,4-beta-cellobiosidase